MRGIIDGVIKQAPEKKISKNGNVYYSVVISDGKSTRFCFVFDSGLFHYIEKLNAGDKVVAKGNIDADCYERNGKNYGSIKMFIDDINIKKTNKKSGMSDESYQDTYEDWDLVGIS